MGKTERLEDKLQNILNDPDSMAQILSMAQSLGIPTDMEQEQPMPSAPPPPDADYVQGIMQLMQRARQTDSKQEALLCALKPFLAPERREKMDRAAQLARISHLAGAALGQSGLFGNKGGR